MHAAHSMWLAVPAVAWMVHVCDLAGYASVSTGPLVGWCVETET